MSTITETERIVVAWQAGYEAGTMAARDVITGGNPADSAKTPPGSTGRNSGGEHDEWLVGWKAGYSGARQASALVAAVAAVAAVAHPDRFPAIEATARDMIQRHLHGAATQDRRQRPATFGDRDDQ